MFPGTRSKRWAIGLCAVLSLFLLYRGTTFRKDTIDEIAEAEPSRPSNFDELDLDSIDYPARFQELRAAEWKLPQHDLDLPFPEGKDGRFVKFNCESEKLGWGDVLSERYVLTLTLCYLTAHVLRLLNTLLAYKSNRGYVFTEYTWKPEYYPWPQQKWLTFYPPVTPLSAFISGPTVGGSWAPGDKAPRSISPRWWDVVCPPERRRFISTRDIKLKLGDASGTEIFAEWQKELSTANESCIEVVAEDRFQEDYYQVFDPKLLASPKVLPLWETFLESPVSQLLKSSSIVERALKVNNHVFTSDESDVDPYSRMLAIQIKRGDSKEACTSLSNQNSTFYGWNLHDSLPDRFEPPAGGNSPENEALYMTHCHPSDEQILQKIRDSKQEYLDVVEAAGRKRTLNLLYLWTNDDGEWLEDIKRTTKAEGWNVVATSRDLKLDRETKEASIAVDMDIARRAAVFIGDGVSYCSTNFSSFLYLLLILVVAICKQCCPQTNSRWKNTHKHSLLLR